MISYNCSSNTSTIFVYLNTELNVEFHTLYFTQQLSDKNLCLYRNQRNYLVNILTT